MNLFIKISLLLTICLCIYCCTFSQNKYCDSLKKVLDNYTKDDTGKVILLYEYSQCQADSNVSQSLQNLQSGMVISSTLHNNDLQVEGMYKASFVYAEQTRFDSAIHILLQALAIVEKAGLKDFRISINSQLGETYRMMSDVKQAEYYDNKTLEASKAVKDSIMIIYTFRNLIALANEEKQWSKLDNLALQALPLASAMHNLYTVASITEIQAEEYISIGQYGKAITNCRIALPIWKDLHMSEEVAYNEATLSGAFTKSNIRDSAIWYAKDALAIAVPNHFYKEIGDAHEALFTYYNHFQDYKTALSEKLILDSINDAQNSISAAKTTLSAEMQYVQQKKDLLARIEKQKQDAAERRRRNWQYGVIGAVALLAIFLLYNNRQKQKAKTKIEKAYSELKSTQSQLIQSEKMASLGELTAGIAHEIQNPLNFVNNFSEVNAELIAEMVDEVKKGNTEEAISIANDIKENEKKINHHGKRADAIVKGMLQHSQSSSGTKESTYINKLADEYLRLGYHGLRSKDKNFNTTLKTDFDESIGMINIISQDIARVLLNLYNNAFYAVNEKKKLPGAEGYEPIVTVTTKKLGEQVFITVSDNGNGIPQKILDKIFQPFFTTKPTGQGTGLGLSLSYDIVKAHGGNIKMETKEGEGTIFIIQLPIV